MTDLQDADKITLPIFAYKDKILLSEYCREDNIPLFENFVVNKIPPDPGENFFHQNTKK